MAMGGTTTPMTPTPAGGKGTTATTQPRPGPIPTPGSKGQPQVQQRPGNYNQQGRFEEQNKFNQQGYNRAPGPFPGMNQPGPFPGMPQPLVQQPLGGFPGMVPAMASLGGMTPQQLEALKQMNTQQPAPNMLPPQGFGQQLAPGQVALTPAQIAQMNSAQVMPSVGTQGLGSLPANPMYFGPGYK